MNRVSTARFRKLRTCPSAETLILYGEAGLAREAGEGVARHLTDCDFCGAELQLLARHWRPDSPLYNAAGEMSASLRRLAEDLLNVPAFDRAGLAEMICGDAEPLTLTDAA